VPFVGRLFRCGKAVAGDDVEAQAKVRVTLPGDARKRVNALAGDNRFGKRPKPTRPPDERKPEGSQKTEVPKREDVGTS
jgi:hypothetical protein